MQQSNHGPQPGQVRMQSIDPEPLIAAALNLITCLVSKLRSAGPLLLFWGIL